MALVILSAAAATDSKVRTISARRLLVGVAALVAGALAGGFWLGYDVARADRPVQIVLAQPETEVETEAPLVETATGEPESRFLIGRVGELSGRLLRLESEAILLAKRLGLKSDDDGEAAEAAGDESKATGKPAEGGPMMPAIGEGLSSSDEAMAIVGSSLEILEADLRRLAETLSTIDEAAAQQTVESMIYPSRQPVFGSRIGSRFGNRSDPFNKRRAFHSGLDFPAPAGSPIYASAGGVVKYAAFRGEYGRQVEIDHGNGLVTRYSHARRLHVKRGDVVTPGQHIADIGSSGRSTGPHLHFEVLKNGRFVDPEDYLREG
ncbi:MAG: M23 family metallopeptidase [Rhodocyclaceae bacterium]|nr:M23 family metallopeptidase [Rhodocyclaceae bacterium]